MPASGNATAPLAIAAAAIAAAASAGAASGQAKIDPDAATPAAPDAESTAKTTPQAAANAAVVASAGQPATATDASATQGAAVAAVAVAPKTATPVKAPAAPTGTAATDDSADTAPVSADVPATAISTAAPASDVAQPAAVAGKAHAAPGALDSAKTEAATPSASAASTAGRAPEFVPAGQAPIESGVQVAGTIQTQLHSVPAAAAAAGPIRVTAATDAPVPLSGLALEIAASALSGKSRFDIRLDPAELGRIDVRIDIDRNGLVTSHLMVEKPETLALLRQDAAQLQRALDDAGLSTGNSGLQFSLRDQSSSGQDDRSESGRNATRLNLSEEDSTPPVVAGRTYGRMLGSSSGVDIRV
ncbi:flagellar hook-length control protein FliK [Bradyrhizobium sp.]|uniref:flagellar hook-length control protein FliK n=1 Tax=Bradyrhizobium sp. TaxID=376 RepID=UPI002736337B|nr:flagellar hook-length control protein FliK [Bradyrhizobium sp.]MDP3077331.1 flagellar hook-length control protein FliK [Bradyrhizobium sp.]